MLVLGGMRLAILRIRIMYSCNHICNLYFIFPILVPDLMLVS